MVLVLVRSWTGSSFLLGIFIACVYVTWNVRATTLVSPQCSMPPCWTLSHLNFYFWFLFESSLVRSRTVFLVCIDCLPCVWNLFWLIMALAWPIIWFPRSFRPPWVGTLSACPQLPAQRHPCTGSFGVLGLWLGAKALGQYPCAQPMPSFSCAFPFDIIRLGFHGPTIQRSSEASMVSVFSFFYKVLLFFSSFHFLGPTLPCPPASSPTFLGFSLPSEVSPSFLGAYSCRS